MIGGGRRALRQVLHQAALVASIRNKDLKLFADRLRKEGKPHKVVAAAVARKLVAVANAFANPASPGRRKPDDGRGHAGPTQRRPCSSQRRRAGISAGRRARTVWKGSWSIPARIRGPAECAGRDCPQAFHAFQASNKTRADPNFDDLEIQLLRALDGPLPSVVSRKGASTS